MALRTKVHPLNKSAPAPCGDDTKVFFNEGLK